MAEIVRVEFRGILGDLPVGVTAQVESVEAGVLLLRLLSAGKPASMEISGVLTPDEAAPQPSEDGNG